MTTKEEVIKEALDDLYKKRAGKLVDALNVVKAHLQDNDISELTALKDANYVLELLAEARRDVDEMVELMTARDAHPIHGTTAGLAAQDVVGG